MSTRLSPYALALVFALGSCAEFPKENVSEAPVQKAAQEMDFIRRQVVSAQQKSARLEVSLSQTNEQIKRLAVEVRKIQNNQNRLEENLNKLRREFLTWKETTRRPAPPRTPANLPRRPQRKAPAAPSSPRPAPVLRSKAPPPAAMKSPAYPPGFPASSGGLQSRLPNSPGGEKRRGHSSPSGLSKPIRQPSLGGQCPMLARREFLRHEGIPFGPR